MILVTKRFKIIQYGIFAFFKMCFERFFWFFMIFEDFVDSRDMVFWVKNNVFCVIYHLWVPSTPKKAIFLVWRLLRFPYCILRSNLVFWVDSGRFQNAKIIFAFSQALKQFKLASKLLKLPKSSDFMPFWMFFTIFPTP